MDQSAAHQTNELVATLHNELDAFTAARKESGPYSTIHDQIHQSCIANLYTIQNGWDFYVHSAHARLGDTRLESSSSPKTQK